MERLSKFYFEFWNQFCPAYTENNAYKMITDPQRPGHFILQAAEFPYLTYSVVRPAFGEQTITSVNIYDKSNSFAELRKIGAAIEKGIPEGGIVFDFGEIGQLQIERSNPFIQSRSLPENETKDNIKSDIASVIIRSFLTN